MAKKEKFMKQVNVYDYAPIILSELGKGILLNTKSGDKINSMTIGWGQIGIEWGKLFFTAYIRHGRFTHKQLEENNEFTISVPLERTPQIAKSIGYCGSKTGRDCDKIKEAGLTPINGISVSSPAIKELPLTIECKVIYRQEQDVENIPKEVMNFYPQEIPSDNPRSNRDYHTVYYGEIVNAYIID